MLVTASVDKMVLKKPPSVDLDLQISGAVIWVGRSSIEVQLEVTQSTNGILIPPNPLLSFTSIPDNTFYLCLDGFC